MADQLLYRPSELFGRLPVDDVVQDAVRGLVRDYRYVFQEMKKPIDWVLTTLNDGLLATPFLAFTIILVLLALRYASVGTAIFTAIALCAIEMMGVWDETMTTLAMVLTSVLFCAIIGIPLGIANFKLVPVSLMPLGKEIVEKRRGGQFDRAADSVAR